MEFFDGGECAPNGSGNLCSACSLAAAVVLVLDAVKKAKKGCNFPTNVKLFLQHNTPHTVDCAGAHPSSAIYIYIYTWTALIASSQYVGAWDQKLMRSNHLYIIEIFFVLAEWSRTPLSCEIEGDISWRLIAFVGSRKEKEKKNAFRNDVNRSEHEFAFAAAIRILPVSCFPLWRSHASAHRLSIKLTEKQILFIHYFIIIFFLSYLAHCCWMPAVSHYQINGLLFGTAWCPVWTHRANGKTEKTMKELPNGTTRPRTSLVMPIMHSRLNVFHAVLDANWI